VLFVPDEASSEAAPAPRTADLARDAMVHWLELGIARGSDELIRRLDRNLDLEPRTAEARTRPPSDVQWAQSFRGDVRGQIVASQTRTERHRFGAALAQTFAAPVESGAELQLQVWNIVLNEVLLTLSGALDLDLVGSLPARIERDASVAPTGAVPFEMSFATDRIGAHLLLDVEPEDRAVFTHHLDCSLVRYLDSFTTWTPP
jgi:hypothetical protein